MIPQNITKEHVLQAIADIEQNGLRYAAAKSRVHELVFNGKPYPPKYTIALANEFANGHALSYDELNTTMAQQYLTKLSPDEFIIRSKNIDAGQRLIENYKQYLVETRLKDELYKWQLVYEYQGRPNLDAADFGQEITSIDYKNLIYHNGIAVRNHLAKDRPEQYRAAFKILFDENISLEDRIVQFQDAVEVAYRSLGVTLSHHHDERTISTFLTYYNPEAYSFYKSSFYGKYCNLIGVKPVQPGKKYVHYMELTSNFIRDYISSDEELLEMVNGLLPDQSFQDVNHKILVQDILYRMLDKKDSSFTTVIDELKASMAEDDSVLRTFSFGPINDKGLKPNRKDTFVWIKDGSGGIGNASAHYEVSIRQRNGKDYFYYVDIHFEGPDKYNYQNRITTLPDMCEWITWQDAKSIAYKGGVSMDDSDLIEKLKEQLLYLEENLGDQIRNVMRNESPEGTVAEAATLTPDLFKLNQILFGPPGTGKTYHTMNKALEIVGVDASALDRKSIKEEFEKRVSDGQIVFTTFHQSMSYEDFIEGIKPNVDSDESESIKYKIEDGILKRLSRRAVAEFYKEEISKKKRDNTSVDRLQLYDEAWNSLLKEVQASLDNGKPLQLPSLSSKLLDVIKITQQGNLVLKPQIANAEEYTVSYPRTQKLFEAYFDLSQVKNIDKEFRRVVGGLNSTAYWCVLNYLNHKASEVSASNAVEVDVEHLNEALVKFDNQIVKANKRESIKRFVLIIDEINRGNVSKVFGELITLVEKDKRLGEQEALEVTLPYSKERFGVPVNLYIIGTMNTADRSVEALDTALRRRFSFEEMQPNPSLLSPAHSYWKLLWDYKSASWEDAQYVSQEKSLLSLLGASQELWTDRQKIWNQMEKEGPSLEQVSYFDGYTFNGVNLQRLLETINARIEVLKDRDHQIGHAYFIHVYGVSDLINIFKDNIIPLLQEYFFGDYYKIQLVLGKGFIQTSAAQVTFAVEEEDAFEEKAVYAINNEAFENESNFLSALKGMKAV
jgi:5-methylcytosine-specific restriction protein B